jgi:hypothetical protein
MEAPLKGRIKKGLGTLIGNAGEYYVIAELLKRGVIAALAPRNAPGFDILATHLGKTVKIRVKTKSEAYHIWQWAAKKDGTIFTHFEGESDFTVLVNLTEETRDLAFFVVKTERLNTWLIKDFQAWLAAPGRKRPHSPDNRKRHLDFRAYAADLESYRNSWSLLWQ